MTGNLLTKIRWARIFGNVLSPQAVRLLNRGLAVGAVFFAALFLWTFFSGSLETEFKKSLRDAQKAASSHGVIFEAPTHHELEFYEKPVEDKSLFRPSSEGPIPFGPSLDAVNAENTALNQMVVVGVLPGDVPQVILEDRTQQKTYYLSPHETTNGITLESMEGDSVTLRRGNETRKLTL